MLIKLSQLEAIKFGKVSLIFRRWKKCRVNRGSIIKSPIGQLEIRDIEIIRFEDIPSRDALSAGYPGLSELKESLMARPDGDIYRIEIYYHSPDPRIELRNKVDISEAEYGQLLSKLARLDRRGMWVQSVLTVIQEHPRLRAIELAEKLGKPKDWLKINIRKLKNLGLTISLDTGYILSPRGEKVLNRIRSEQI